VYCCCSIAHFQGCLWARHLIPYCTHLVLFAQLWCLLSACLGTPRLLLGHPGSCMTFYACVFILFWKCTFVFVWNPVNFIAYWLFLPFDAWLNLDLKKKIQSFSITVNHALNFDQKDQNWPIGKGSPIIQTHQLVCN